jgi:protein SCO1
MFYLNAGMKICGFGELFRLNFVRPGFGRGQMKRIFPGLLVCLLVCLGSCKSRPDWRLHDVSGHLPDLRFSLVSDSGENVTASDYRGSIVLLYFGFTNCPDECPLAMARLSKVLRELEPEAASVRVLFVTVDPAIDTAARLHDYMAAFDPRHMTGLTGSPGDIMSLAKRYRVAIERHQDDAAHSNTVFIFDGTGRARLLLTPEDTDDELIHDLRRLTP